MKIKHFAGYGTVSARKIRKDENTLVVEVKGEHEYGLVREDEYDVFKWLVARFDNSRKDWTEISKVEVSSRYEPNKDAFTGYEEIATYTIHFKGAAKTV